MMGSSGFSRREFGLGAAAMASGLTLGCGPASPALVPPPDLSDHQSLLAWAAAGPLRLEPERDEDRHPIETLDFWGLRPSQTVLELFPGRGWYSAILAPYLAASGGRLIVASWAEAPNPEAEAAVQAAFDDHFAQEPAVAEAIGKAALTAGSEPLAEPQSVDLAIVARNVHTLMAAGLVEAAFGKIFQALKPGGVLGVEQHRAAASGVQDPLARSGYVQEAYVRELAEAAGFALVGSTDLNANPRDTKDHPFGVWTLPPVLRTAPRGRPPDPRFDTRPFRAIGESDRMTLKFIRPLLGEGVVQ
jgi:predicted methyltransferase